MPLVEVQPRTEIPPGTYEAVVNNVQPDTIVPRTGNQAGETVPVLRWSFTVEGVDERIESITGRDPSSAKSNLFKYFVAVLGNDKSAWLKAETEDLVGRPVLITLSVNDDGWPRVDSVSARPVKRPATITVDADKPGPFALPAAAAPQQATDLDEKEGDLPF